MVPGSCSVAANFDMNCVLVPALLDARRAPVAATSIAMTALAAVVSTATTVLAEAISNVTPAPRQFPHAKAVWTATRAIPRCARMRIEAALLEATLPQWKPD